MMVEVVLMDCGVMCEWFVYGYEVGVYIVDYVVLLEVLV